MNPVMTNTMMIRVLDESGRVRVLSLGEVQRSFRMDEEELRSLVAGDRVTLEAATVERELPLTG